MTIEQIVNQALVEIGAELITDINSTTENNAKVARLFYDTARKEIIRQANWGFARVTESLEKCKVLELADAPANGLVVDQASFDTGLATWSVDTEENSAIAALPPGWLEVKANLSGYELSTNTRGFSCVIGADGAELEGNGGVWIAGVELGNTLVIRLVSDTSPEVTVQSVTLPADEYISTSTGGWNNIDVELANEDEEGGYKVFVNDKLCAEFTQDEIDYILPSASENFFVLNMHGLEAGVITAQKLFSIEVSGTPAGLPGHFDYKYKVPESMVKFLYVSKDNLPIERHGPCFMSNDDELIVTYLSDITELTRYPPHFVSALIALLRARLAVPAGGRYAKKQDWYALYDIERKEFISTEGSSESANPERFGIKKNSDPWLNSWRN